MYNHPLQVRRAIGKLKADILFIQRNMKDLFLSSYLDDSNIIFIKYDREAIYLRDIIYKIFIFLIEKNNYFCRLRKTIFLKKYFIKTLLIGNWRFIFNFRRYYGLPDYNFRHNFVGDYCSASLYFCTNFSFGSCFLFARPIYIEWVGGQRSENR